MIKFFAALVTAMFAFASANALAGVNPGIGSNQMSMSGAKIASPKKDDKQVQDKEEDPAKEKKAD